MGHTSPFSNHVGVREKHDSPMERAVSVSFKAQKSLTQFFLWFVVDISEVHGLTIRHSRDQLAGMCCEDVRKIICERLAGISSETYVGNLWMKCVKKNTKVSQYDVVLTRNMFRGRVNRNKKHSGCYVLRDSLLNFSWK